MMTLRKLFINILGIVGLLVMLSMTSCTNLSENPEGTITPANFFKNKAQFLSALGTTYSHLSKYTAINPFNSLNETTSDELVIPAMGTDWYDGGSHIRLHKQTWTYKHSKINGVWNFLYGGVNSTNRLIYQLNNQKKEGNISQANVTKYTSELKVLRAFYYFWLLDMYGNVPIVTKFKDAKIAPANSKNFQSGRDRLFKFVESQIKDNIQNLSRANDVTTFARMNVWAAHFLLAKLYLNAKVYTGKERWQGAAAQCDSIINSDKFRLASDYFANFANNTENDPEMIWAIPFDTIHLPGNDWANLTAPVGTPQKFQVPWKSLGAYEAVQDFYFSFKDNDFRKRFLVGLQLDPDGNPIIDPGAFGDSPHGDTVWVTPYTNELQPLSWRTGGARFLKYYPDKGSKTNMNKDVPIMRYADVLLMKAECLWRMNNKNPSVAVHLVNMVRERAGLSDYGSLSRYKILKERGHELYIEEWRRQDLIRFKGGMHYKYNRKGKLISKFQAGKTAFNDAWRFKKVSQPYHNVFPIPRAQLQANPNLTQNPGY